MHLRHAPSCHAGTVLGTLKHGPPPPFWAAWGVGLFDVDGCVNFENKQADKLSASNRANCTRLGDLNARKGQIHVISWVCLMCVEAQSCWGCRTIGGLKNLR